MLRSILVCLALSHTLFAQTLDEITSSSINNHNSLKAIESRLSGFEELYELSRNFENPTLSLSISDIQMQDPTERSLEPMQATSIYLKQKIPYFGKRDASSSLIMAKKSVLLSSLEVAKSALVKNVKKTAYTIWEYEEKERIVDEHIQLIKKNIELSSVYSSSGDASHMQAMTMRLSLSQLNIKKDKIKTMLEILYARISYLAFMDVTSVELELKVLEPKSLQTYLEKLQNNKTYQKKLSETKAKSELVKVKELDSMVDPFVSVGYYYREVNPDYVNLSIGASLPLYGSESLKEQKVKKEFLESSILSKDFYQHLNAELSEFYSQLRNTHNTYEIISNESIPEIEHMFELSGSMLKSGKNLLLYTNLLEKRLGLYEQKISAMASYKRALCDIEELTGEIQ